MQPVRLVLISALALVAPQVTSLFSVSLAGEATGSGPQSHRAQLAQSSRSAVPECFCWANGQRFAHGEQACLKGLGEARLATCDRVINVMSWSLSAEACPES